MGTTIQHRLGVLGDLLIEVGGGLVPVHHDGVAGADGDAATAAHALVVVDSGLLIGDGDGAVGADAGASAAAHAVLLRNAGLAGVVLLHLTGARAAAHANILHSAAEACLLMALKVAERDEHVGIHDGAADLGLLHQFAAHYGDFHLVVALQAVGDDDLTAGGHRREAVEHGAVHVIQRILTTTHIQGITVGEERLAATFLNEIRHRLCPVGAQEGQVAGLTEMELDGYIFLVKVDLPHARRGHQAGQLLLQILTVGGAEIRVVHFRCHNRFPLCKKFFRNSTLSYFLAVCYTELRFF